MDEIRAYLNRVQWSTITVLSEMFNMTRNAVVIALAEMRIKQEVRVYDNEIIHV